MKRGESISMSVIIIAAIALLVLVILAVLVLKAGGSVSTGTGCRGVGGNCATECQSFESQSASQSRPLGNCPEDTPVCCVPVDVKPAE